jgi:hypothetical protein
VNLNLAETGLNWDTVLKAIPVVAAVLGALYKLRDSRPRRRATLKADLELLRAAREQKLDCRSSRLASKRTCPTSPTAG